MANTLQAVRPLILSGLPRPECRPLDRAPYQADPEEDGEDGSAGGEASTRVDQRSRGTPLQRGHGENGTAAAKRHRTRDGRNKADSERPISRS